MLTFLLAPVWDGDQEAPSQAVPGVTLWGQL